jgi:ABC-type multidrug transport system ATPase subunit
MSQPEPAEPAGITVTDPVLRIGGLTRRFGAREVLRELDLEVGRGGRLALTGPNGSGKTTLLRCVAGTVAPTAGTITVAGHDAGSLEARRAIGLSLSQERSFYLRLSGTENLRLFARFRGLSRRAATSHVDELLHELELAEIAAQRCDRCSTGQLQQLSIARALLGEPPLLLFDEPTRSLDDRARERFWGALERRPHAAVVCTTHLRADLDRLPGEIRLDTTGEADG